MMTRTSNPADPLHWLWTEYLTQEKYHVPFDNGKNIQIAYNMLSQFIGDISKIFKNRIICVSTHLTNFAYSDSLKKIYNISNINKNMVPFYKSSKITNGTIDYEYAQRLYAAEVYSRIATRKHGISVPVVKFDGPYFMDYDHPEGLTPFHLTEESCQQIGELIFNAAEELRNY
jgi:hypothetical protein